MLWHQDEPVYYDTFPFNLFQDSEIDSQISPVCHPIAAPTTPFSHPEWVIFQNSDSHHQIWELSVTKGLFSQFSGNII